MKTHMLSVIALLSSATAFSTAAEDIDLLVVVDPAVVQAHGYERVAKVLEEQLAKANDEFGGIADVKFSVSAVTTAPNNSVTDALGSGQSYAQALGATFFSMGKSQEEFDAEFADHEWYAGKYDAAIGAELNKFHADKLVYLAGSADNSGNYQAIGLAFRNLGLVLDFDSLFTHRSTFAHELGHTFGLGHPSDEVCGSGNYLMCQGKTLGSGFLADEVERVVGVVNRDPEFLLDYFEPNFWGGSYNQPMEYEALARVSVADNPIPETINKTEILVELVDTEGVPVVFDKTTSVELFTNGISAVSGTHYDTDVFQRLQFAPGESSIRVDLPVVHDASDVMVQVGARYGVNIGNSNVSNVVIKAKSDSNSGGDGNNNSGDNNGGGDSGGSLGFLSLVLLPLALLRRKR